MSTTVYSVIVGDNDQERVEAYLYSHTTISVAVCIGKLTAYVLRTTVEGGGGEPGSHGTLASSERALYLANYQTQRLASGCYGVRLWGVTQGAALTSVKQFAGDELDSNERVAEGIRRAQANR